MSKRSRLLIRFVNKTSVKYSFLDNRKEWRKFERVQKQAVEYQLRSDKALKDYEYPSFLTCLRI